MKSGFCLFGLFIAVQAILSSAVVSADSLSELWTIKDWPIQSLDTTVDAVYMDALEKDVLLHLNMVRSNPSRYAKEFIEPGRKFYNDKFYKEPGTPDNFLGIRTQEGGQALIESVKA